ncbi:MAG: TRM11 family methyltransferase [Candidatus Bathyarchaeota archaeon]|nr:TRM11 family methyltransferase [Candidatus Bathyarchaeota archaeon]
MYLGDKEFFALTDLFFTVSGEHTTLPFAEINAILESAGISSSGGTVFTRVLCVTSTVESAYLVARRSSMTKVCGLELFRCDAEWSEIQRRLRDVPFTDYVKKGQSFSVRLTSFDTSHVNTLGLEREVGDNISRKVPDASVNLVDPDRSFIGFFADSMLIFGVKVAEASAKRFDERMPVNRPFLHPSTMPPKLARCMVNLARAPSGCLVLDPFCGAGSILLEAGAVGCRVVGSDVDDVMVEGCSRNLKYFRIPFDGLLVGDARRLPYTVVDCIVSDPPYGRASSTHGASPIKLVSDFLFEAMSILPRGGYLSLSLPGGWDWRAVAVDLGYAFVDRHFVREHKSLTREILIIKAP